MSENTCPKCGASAAATWHSDYNGTAIDYMCGHTIYADGTETQGKDCLRNQLAQAKARIAELESRDVQAIMQEGDTLNLFEGGEWCYDTWEGRCTYRGATAAEALAKTRKATGGGS